MGSVIFDLDGTLADTSADLIAAANACFDKPQLDAQADAATAFAGGRAMLTLGLSRLGFPDGNARTDKVNALYPVLLEHYGENIDRYTVLYPGVERCLDLLATKGWLLGVCTNKPEGLAQDLLVRLGIRDRFGAMIGADTLPTRKPDAAPLLETIRLIGGDPAKATLIGDTVTDREAARNAGVPSVLVTFGPTGMAVRDLQPEALLDHYDDLPAVLSGLFD